MLAKLGEELVEVTGAYYGDLVHAIATRVGIGSFRVLVYSFDESNDEQSSSRRVQVDFRGLNSSQSPKISHYRIDSDHSNPYAVWLRANKPGQPQQELADDLKEQSHLQTVDLTQILIRENLLSATFELPVSACSLLSVEANQVTR
jgi:xylan 1,4-beta-xylosidase